MRGKWFFSAVPWTRLGIILLFKRNFPINTHFAPVALGSPIKGRVKEKNTPPQEKTCRFFFDTSVVVDSVLRC
jgi:hypothetical protein